MELQNLRTLYVTELQRLHSIESQLIVALPKLTEAATHPKLKAAFEDHLADTKKQQERLEKIFDRLGENPAAQPCRAAVALIEEVTELTRGAGETEVRDAGLIAGAQKIEHLEIAGYGAVVHYAGLLDAPADAKLLQKSLDEEYSADRLLNKLATKKVNQQALHLPANGYAYESDQGSSFPWGAVLAITAVGAAVAYLLPRMGEDTKKQINDTVSDLLTSAKEGARDLRDQAEEKGKAWRDQIQNNAPAWGQQAESAGRDLIKQAEVASRDLRNQAESVGRDLLDQAQEAAKKYRS